MNRYAISYYNKDKHNLQEDKVNALTMKESLNKFNQVRKGVEPEGCRKVGKLENCHAPQTKDYEHYS